MYQVDLVGTIKHGGPVDLAGIPPAVSWLAVPVGEMQPNASGLATRFHRRLIGRSMSDSTDVVPLSRTPPARLDDYDLVELDSRCDLNSATLEKVPAEKRIICWFGRASAADELQREYARLACIPARFYKLVCQADEPSDALPVMEFLHRHSGKNVIAYASQPAGLWSRVLGACLGSPLVEASLLPGTDQDTLTVAQLIDDYGLPKRRPLTGLCGIVGQSAAQSLSPLLHNAAYEALGIPFLFLPFPASDFERFWHSFISTGATEFSGLKFAGATIASPFKESGVACANDVSRVARQAASCNVVYRQLDHWRADTTDGTGVVDGLQEMNVEFSSAAVIGCGGSGRVIAASLREAGAQVTMVNRGALRGQLAEKLVKAPFVQLSEFDPSGYSIIVNATPVGKKGEPPPFDIHRMSKGAVVVDLTYGPETTPLISTVRHMGHRCLDGHQILVRQVRRQFRLMTGVDMREQPRHVPLGTVDLAPA